MVVLVNSFCINLNYSVCVSAMNDGRTSSSKYCPTCAVADVAVLTLQQLKVQLFLRQHPDNSQFAASVSHEYHFVFCSCHTIFPASNLYLCP